MRTQARPSLTMLWPAHRNVHTTCACWTVTERNAWEPRLASTCLRQPGPPSPAHHLQVLRARHWPDPLHMESARLPWILVTAALPWCACALLLAATCSLHGVEMGNRMQMQEFTLQ